MSQPASLSTPLSQTPLPPGTQLNTASSGPSLSTSSRDVRLTLQKENEQASAARQQMVAAVASTQQLDRPRLFGIPLTGNDTASGNAQQNTGLTERDLQIMAGNIQADGNTPLVYLPRLNDPQGQLHPSVLHTDADSDKLFTVLCNYLSLAQLELARTVINQLFLSNPDRVVRALRAIVFTHIPSSWLFSRAVPSAGHLSWLAYIEYRKLFVRVFPSRSVLIETLQKAATGEDWIATVHTEGTVTAFGDGASSAVVALEDSSEHADSAAAVERDTEKPALPSIPPAPINPYGFISHDRIKVTVVEADQVRGPKEVYAYTLRLKLDKQTQLSPVTSISNAKPNPVFRHTFDW